MQWADQASLDVLTHLFKSIDRAAVVFCLVLRREQKDNVWKVRDYAYGMYEHRYTQINLQALDDEASAKVLSNFTRGIKFRDEVRDQIISRSLGNPRYIKEIVEILIKNRLIVRSEEDRSQWVISGEIEDIPLPVSLKSSLVSRIDNLLENTRNALRVAAVFGRRFPLSLLRELLDYDLRTKHGLATWSAPTLFDLSKTRKNFTNFQIICCIK